MVIELRKVTPKRVCTMFCLYHSVMNISTPYEPYASLTRQYVCVVTTCTLRATVHMYIDPHPISYHTLTHRL